VNLGMSSDKLGVNPSRRKSQVFEGEVRPLRVVRPLRSRRKPSSMGKVYSDGDRIVVSEMKGSHS